MRTSHIQEHYLYLAHSNASQLKVALTAILTLHVKSFVQQVKVYYHWLMNMLSWFSREENKQLECMIKFVLIDECLSPAIHELARRYREEFNLPNLKMPFNNNRGFYISFPERDLQQASMPSIFNQVFHIFLYNIDSLLLDGSNCNVQNLHQQTYTVHYLITVKSLQCSFLKVDYIYHNYH